MEAVVGSAQQVNNEKWTLRQKLVGIVVSPRQTFEYLAKNPDWVTPLSAAALSGILLAYALTPKVIETLNKVSSNDNLTSFKHIILGLGFVFSPLAAIMSLLIGSLIYYVIGNLFISKRDFREAVSLFGYASLPNTIRIFLVALISFFSGKIVTQQGLSGLIANSNNSVIKIILSNIDLLSLWSLFLCTLAFSVLFNTTTRKASIAIIAIWTIPVIIQIAFN